MTLLMNQTICFSAICMCFFTVVVVETILFVCFQNAENLEVWGPVTGSLLNHWTQHSMESFHMKAHSLQVLSPVPPHLLSSVLFCSLPGYPVPGLHVSLGFLLLPIILPNFLIICAHLSPYDKLFLFCFLILLCNFVTDTKYLTTQPKYMTGETVELRWCESREERSWG